MKRIFVLPVLGVILLAACAKKIAPENSEKKTSKKTEETKTTPPLDVSLNPSDAGSGDTNPAADMNKETLITSGEAVFKSNCGKCHALKSPGDYTSEKWDAILKVEFSRAKLDGKQQQEVFAYIKANAKK